MSYINLFLEVLLLELDYFERLLLLTFKVFLLKDDSL